MNKTLKILAIDDEPAKLRETYDRLQQALHDRGVELKYKIVPSDEYAIQMLKDGFRPDAITQDYMMFDKIAWL